MKITFISLLEDVSIPALRFLSAFIKQKGYESEIIMLPRFYSEGLDDRNSFLYPYPPIVLAQLSEKCAHSDLIGISLMSCHFDNAVLITRYLRKRLPCPIIWGGIHPTIRPLECLNYADMVCIGEGELSLSMLMEKMSDGESWKSISIPGIIKKGKKLMQFLPGPILEDLGKLPLPDYNLEHQFLLYEKNQIVQLNKNLLARCLNYSYRTTCSRGCPYSCAYCCNNALNKIYEGKLLIRQRPIKDIIEELKLAKRIIPDLKLIIIADDAFLAQSQERIDKFSEEYKKEINLPFEILTTPITCTFPKMKALSQAGMCSTGVGVQSGSLRTRVLYNRHDTIDQVLAVGEVVNQVVKETKKKIRVRYDFIVDNPWEKEEDMENSLRLALKLKKPFDLALFSLTFYPGTELYNKAHQEGIIKDDLNQVYRKSQLVPSRSYLNALFTLLSVGMSKFLVNLLLNKHIPKKYLVSTLYFLIALYTLKKKLKTAIVEVFFQKNFQWFYVRCLDIIKNRIRLMEHNKLIRFSGRPGEI